MRNAFRDAMVARASRPDFVFLTGDLGFGALEPLRDALGGRFLNMGVAEQNMVSVAAGLTTAGLRPWAYSIAPFLYARAYEQIRNDVALHDAPVTLVGNGGGYGYGVMGATHHALEDYGTLLCLKGLSAFIPAFAADVAPCVQEIFDRARPAYLRLGRDETPKGPPPPAYAPWRRLTAGGGAAVVVVGPLVGSIWAACAALDEARRPNLWVAAELPIEAASIPPGFLDDVRRADRLVVVEEHVAHGGAGPALAAALAELGRSPRRFAHRAARGYESGLYGSQDHHRRESGLDAASVAAGL